LAIRKTSKARVTRTTKNT